jgi:hypothetical protein
MRLCSLKKIRASFESQDVTRLLDARRLQDDQFTDKAIDSSETKVNFVVEIKDFLLCQKKLRGFLAGK